MVVVRFSLSQLPSIAITEYLGQVANATALIGLTGQQGDWASVPTRVLLGLSLPTMVLP